MVILKCHYNYKISYEIFFIYGIIKKVIRMKKKNGYTIIELTVLLFVMGIVTLVVLTKTSYAFKDSNDEVRYNQAKLIIKQAEKYGESIKEELKTEVTKTIVVQTLIDQKLLIPNEDGKIISAEDDNKYLNSDKIELKYDTKSNSVVVIYPKK